jgi:hypothetical protein
MDFGPGGSERNVLKQAVVTNWLHLSAVSDCRIYTSELNKQRNHSFLSATPVELHCSIQIHTSNAS